MAGLHSAGGLPPKKGRWHVIQSLFFIFVFSLSAFFFLQSPFFRVREIQIYGNKQLSSEDITTLAGLSRGINIFKADLKLAAEKTALHPLVKDVEIKRELPAVVIIEITERQSIGLAAGQGEFALISDDGFYLSTVKNLGEINLPIITGVNVSSLGPGQKIPDKRIEPALKYLMHMPVSMRATVSEINVSDLNNIRMYTIDRAEVRFGNDERVEDKINLYREVKSQKYDNDIQYIDISYKGSPVIKFIEPAEQEKQ